MVVRIFVSLFPCQTCRCHMVSGPPDTCDRLHRRLRFRAGADVPVTAVNARAVTAVTSAGRKVGRRAAADLDDELAADGAGEIAVAVGRQEEGTGAADDVRLVPAF